MKRSKWLYRHLLVWSVLAVLAAVIIGCQDPPLPENVGYLRSAGIRGGELTIFDAATFEIHRSVKLPKATASVSHRLEIDPSGRIWIGYTQWNIEGLLRRKAEVLVFSPQGKLERRLDVECDPPNVGIAFANGYAFVGCAASGFFGALVVIDLSTLEEVKRFDRVHPPDQDPLDQAFYIVAVEEIDGSILVFGKGGPPEDYQRLTPHSAITTRVGVIDAETLEFRGFQTELPPGLRVRSVVEVDGKAWIMNSLSHIQERPPRTDIYVMDPNTLEIVDRFNLEHPFPTWADVAEDGTVHIFNQVRSNELAEAGGYKYGITRLDPETREETFIETPDFSEIHGLAVYEERTCLAVERFAPNGLWCLNDRNELELKIAVDDAVGVVFTKTGAPEVK